MLKSNQIIKIVFVVRFYYLGSVINFLLTIWKNANRPSRNSIFSSTISECSIISGVGIAKEAA